MMDSTAATEGSRRATAHDIYKRSLLHRDADIVIDIYHASISTHTMKTVQWFPLLQAKPSEERLPAP